MPSKSWFEVKLQAVCVVVVDAADESEAMTFAVDEAQLDAGVYEFIEGGPARAISDDKLDSAKRHANLVIHDDE